MASGDYELVRLANGACSVRYAAYGETLHPVAGPVAEAEALYVRQLGLAERLAASNDGFVIWDIGLGVAANTLTAIRALQTQTGRVRIVSFDDMLDPLRFALEQRSALPHLDGFEHAVEALLSSGRSAFTSGALTVDWEAVVGDFPSALAAHRAESWPKPHAICFDPFSPATNPAMWTLSVFERLFARLDPARACSLATYSRTTFVRVALLLAGFFAGVGESVAGKEETTIAANNLRLIASPLDRRWLERARRSHSAEPLHEAVYRQAPLSDETWSRLQAHPQFR